MKYHLSRRLNTAANGRPYQEFAADDVSILANPGFSYLLCAVPGRGCFVGAKLFVATSNLLLLWQ
jgi:hypothetical protein